jgi:phosphate butyryltransferase
MLRINELLPKVKHLPRQRLAVVAAEDPIVLDAVVDAVALGLIEPILIGNEEIIKKHIQNKKIQAQIIPTVDTEDAAKIAVRMIKNKEADFLMKGLIETKVLLKAVVNSETGIKSGRLLSHVALFSFSVLDRVLIATDCAMNIQPDEDGLIGIIENAVLLAKTLEYKKPKVAIISATEKVNPKLASSVMAEKLTQYFQNANDCAVQGPFALDNVVSISSAQHKGLSGEVAGKADILVFPNLDSGNIFYKTAVFLANADAAGIIVGAQCPIVLTSRSDSGRSKLNSIILAMVYNYGLQNLSD